MIEGYSFMDWVTLGGILTTIASLVGIAIKLARDNSGLKAEMKALSKEREMEHDSLSSEHRGLSKEHDALSKEHASIKKDTEYISDEMKYEKMARENLYKNSTKAKEILETMDLMTCPSSGILPAAFMASQFFSNSSHVDGTFSPNSLYTFLS